MPYAGCRPPLAITRHDSTCCEIIVNAGPQTKLPDFLGIASQFAWPKQVAAFATFLAVNPKLGGPTHLKGEHYTIYKPNSGLGKWGLETLSASNFLALGPPLLKRCFCIFTRLKCPAAESTPKSFMTSLTGGSAG